MSAQRIVPEFEDNPLGKELQALIPALAFWNNQTMIQAPRMRLFAERGSLS